MATAIAETPEVLHSLPGRMRVHLPGAEARQLQRAERALRRVAGVRSVRMSAQTGNLLVLYDPEETSERAILASLPAPGAEPEERSPAGQAPERARVVRTDTGTKGVRRARIPIRGLERHPEIARHVVEHLRGHPGVRTLHPSALTGRLLVEYDEHETDIDDLLAEIVSLELPDLPEEDDPAHPLEKRPLLQSITRSIGATLGLGLVGLRRAASAAEPLPGAATATQISSIISVLEGVPAFRYGIRRLLGRDLAEVLIHVPSIIMLTFSQNVLGLLLTGSEALRLLTEVVPRQAAFRRYEEGLSAAPSAAPDAVIRLEAGELPPRDAEVLDGAGTALGRSGLPLKVAPGAVVPAGARLYGGPFELRLRGAPGYERLERAAPPYRTLTQHYANAVGLASLGYAALTALLTRSYTRTFAALLLVNPRVALIGEDMAQLGAAARVLRAGVTIVGTRVGRSVRLPNAVLLDGPRTVVEGWEISEAQALRAPHEAAEVYSRAGMVATAAGAPWGGAFRAAPKPPEGIQASAGGFDGEAATARVGETRYWLRPARPEDGLPEALRRRHEGESLLVLGSDEEAAPFGVIAVRPRLAPGCAALVEVCRAHGVELCLCPGEDRAASEAVARRARIALLAADDALGEIRRRQWAGELVAYVSDYAYGGAAFDICDMGIGLTTGRSQFPARADFLAPDLRAVADFVEAGARRAAAARDAVALALVANVGGAVMGLRAAVGLERASALLSGAALAAVADQWARLRGGVRSRAALWRLQDPRPERWGARGVEETLAVMKTTPMGLTSQQAGQRHRGVLPIYRRRPLWQLALEQLKSPLTAFLGVGAAASLVFGAPADVVIIGATIAGNVLVGAWQERKADQVAESLNRLGATVATVLRDGQPRQLPAPELVPGDVLLLAPGTRVAADARLIEAEHLEADEAALTGESLPVRKAADGPTDGSRIVLDGSDITTGMGKAVVCAVGRGTRMGATAAAVAADERAISPLDARLSQALQQIVPIALAGGALVTGAGWLRTRQPFAAIGTGSTIALASIPEGLPILTRVSEAGVAKRLADRNALMRRLSAVEALGRVDVACTDKTGTLTQGRLALTLVAEAWGAEARLPGPLSAGLQAVLATAGLASPAPDAPGARAHPTDVAVVEAARAAGLGERLAETRRAESPFDPVRGFHATRVAGRLCVKGAPEALLPRCARIRAAEGDGETQALDDAERAALMGRVRRLAERGLRVLLVAEGAEATPPEAVRDLTALGFIGISDPLRPDVPAAVRRCHEAGIRVIMLTGDHPATAEAIAREAGLVNGVGGIVTAEALAELPPDELDAALAEATVIARATPLDKLRIIESLQRQGHTVAMTGDGVNDAPALRLADAGIAMGRGGTEVARQTADVVLSDDNFATLVEALVEGRSFWHNIRRAVGLLVGGNLGELGLVVGASVLGLAAPLTARQILVVNMISDVLPGLAVALQPPEHRKLADLAREGTAALDRPLRADVLRRGLFTAGPSLAAYALALTRGTPGQAQTVALASIITTQLGQTLDVGWTEGHLSRPLLGAVGGSAGLLGVALAVPPVSRFLGVTLPTPVGWALIGGATALSTALGRLYSGVVVKQEPPTASGRWAPRVAPRVRVWEVPVEEADGEDSGAGRGLADALDL